MIKIIITAPSLNPSVNVSGISSVVNFIINNNINIQYQHFELGKSDADVGSMLNRVKRNFRSYDKWKTLLEKERISIIHYNWPLSKLSIIRDFPFMRFAVKQNRKIVVHIHGGQFLRASRIPWYLKLILKKVFKYDIPFIVLSDDEKLLLQSQFKAKHVEVVPNCVELKDAENFYRKSYDNILNLGYLGRIEANKGMFELLLACKEMKEKVPFVLHIAGKEDDKKNAYLFSFKETLGEQFVYEGIISGNKKVDFLKKIDILIMPTYFEGLPMSLLECMSFGCVPVITPVGSIPSVCQNEINAKFIKVKDVSSIVDAITNLYIDKESFERLSIEAKKTIFNKFSPKVYIDKLNEIYNAL